MPNFQSCVIFMVRGFILVLLAVVAQATPVTPRIPPRLPNWGFVVRVEEYKAITNTDYGDTTGKDLFFPACAHTTDPTPLYTPNPTLQEGPDVAMSLIVGVDGRPFAGFVLSGSDNDFNVRAIFGAMEKWRFRPATCNGVPTESQGVIVFRPMF